MSRTLLHAPPAGRWDDDVVELHHGKRWLAVDPACARGRDWRRAPVGVERGRRHAEWPEHSSLHGLVVRGAELELGISDVPADEPCRRHEQVRILEHLTELARRREGREPVELFRRDAPDLE